MVDPKDFNKSTIKARTDRKTHEEEKKDLIKIKKPGMLKKLFGGGKDKEKEREKERRLA